MAVVSELTEKQVADQCAMLLESQRAMGLLIFEQRKVLDQIRKALQMKAAPCPDVDELLKAIGVVMPESVPTKGSE